MATSQTQAEASSLGRDMLRSARHYLGNRRALLIIALVAIVGGIALNWSWLVAAGIAPVLLTTLPCLVMCGLGLCMHKMIGGSRASQPSQPDQSGPTQTSGPGYATQTNGGLLAHVASCCGISGKTNDTTESRKTEK